MFLLYGMKIKNYCQIFQKSEYERIKFQMCKKRTRILISRDIAYFPTIVGKVNMSSC